MRKNDGDTITEVTKFALSTKSEIARIKNQKDK